MRLSEIFTNPHFCNLVAILRVPLQSWDWREEYPKVRFTARIDHIESLMTKEHFEDQSDKYEFTQLFVDLIKDVRLADARLRYTKEDIQWLVEVMEQDYALVIMSMLFASANAEDRYMTPPEIAARTGTSESNWRNKAAAGDFPGAIKRGKVWLIPYSVLRSRGIVAEYPSHEDAAAAEEPQTEID